MLPASKHFTMVVGVDIHLTTLPPFNPMHPYVGMVMDVADYIPLQGSTTNINGVPRGVADTGGVLTTGKHVPIASGPFACAPVIAHESSNYYGAMNTFVEGSRLSPAGYMIMTCADAGVPLNRKPGKSYKAVPSLFAPTSMSIPVVTGAPVIVGGPYIPDFDARKKELTVGFGFGAVIKGTGNVFRKLGKADKENRKEGGGTEQRISGPSPRPPGFKAALPESLCVMGFDPVNLVTGAVQHEGTDFEFPGIIPLRWDWCWDSDCRISGPLGYGVSFCYDMRIEREREREPGIIVVALADGRPASFPEIDDKDSAFNRREKLTLSRDGNSYVLFDHEERLSYHFNPVDLNETTVYRLCLITNGHGHSVRLSYNGRRLSGITDTAGRELEIVTDKAGRIIRVDYLYDKNRDMLVSYTYNEAGDLCGVTDALGQTMVIEYSGHLMTKRTDRNGQSFYWEYEKIRGELRCVHTWGDDGWLEGKIEYHKGYNLVTNSLGETSRYDFTPEGYITAVTDPLGNMRRIQYTEDKDIYRVIDAEGNITGYDYNEKGQLTHIYYPDGGEQLYGYDADGHVNIIQSPEGRSTTFFYEGGLVKYANLANGTVITYQYDEYRQLSGIRSGGREQTFAYDTQFNLSKMAVNGVVGKRWWYDAYGRVCVSENGEGRVRRWSYDRLGRVVRDMLPDGNTVELTYDAYDNVVEAKDKQRKVVFSYTPLGSMKSREEDGKSVRFIYNRAEQLMAVVNEMSERYSFSRDGAGQIIREMGFDGVERRYERNSLGLISHVMRPGNRQDFYEYNLQGQVSYVRRYDGTWKSYSYDHDGYLKEARNTNSILRIERDAMGQVVKEWQDGYEIASSYDELGERVRITSSLGMDVAIGYAPAGYPERVRAGQAGILPWEMELRHNGAGQETERILAGGVQGQWDYNLYGRPDYHTVRVGGHKTRDMRYRWGMNDCLAGTANELTGGGTEFRYDRIGTLIEGAYPDGTKIFRTADAVGNLYKSVEKRDRRYGAGGRLLEMENTKLLYDDEGNLVEKTNGEGRCWRYEWNADGMLQQVVRPDFEKISFEYDVLGRRTAKIWAGAVTRWLWDGDTPFHEWTYAGIDRPKAVWDEMGFEGKDREEPVTADFITWIFEENSCRPAAKITGGKCYSVITDYLGTPVQMYDGEGRLSWQCTLDIYGEIHTSAGNSVSDCPFRYQGQYADEETGLYYNRFRYYSPETGGYISQDPLGLSGNNPTLYNYVSNNNKEIDLYGLHPLIGFGPEHMRCLQINNIQDIVLCSGSPGDRFTRWDHKEMEKAVEGMALPDKMTPYDYRCLYGRTGNSSNIKGNIVKISLERVCASKM